MAGKTTDNVIEAEFVAKNAYVPEGVAAQEGPEDDALLADYLTALLASPPPVNLDFKEVSEGAEFSHRSRPSIKVVNNSIYFEPQPDAQELRLENEALRLKVARLIAQLNEAECRLDAVLAQNEELRSNVQNLSIQLQLSQTIAKNAAKLLREGPPARKEPDPEPPPVLILPQPEPLVEPEPEPEVLLEEVEPEIGEIETAHEHPEPEEAAAGEEVMLSESVQELPEAETVSEWLETETLPEPPEPEEEFADLQPQGEVPYAAFSATEEILFRIEQPATPEPEEKEEPAGEEYGPLIGPSPPVMAQPEPPVVKTEEHRKVLHVSERPEKGLVFLQPLPKPKPNPKVIKSNDVNKTAPEPPPDKKKVLLQPPPQFVPPVVEPKPEPKRPVVEQELKQQPEETAPQEIPEFACMDGSDMEPAPVPKGVLRQTLNHYRQIQAEVDSSRHSHAEDHSPEDDNIRTFPPDSSDCRERPASDDITR